MPALQAVTDACVLIPAALCDTLLRAAAVGLYRLYWSEDILQETSRNLVAHGMTTEEQAARRIAAMRRNFPEAEILASRYQPLVDAMTNHEKDRHVLAAAVAARAEVIVTLNLKHFPNDALEPFGIEAQPPDQFLLGLLDLDPDLMDQVVWDQAMDLRRPPMPVEAVLQRIKMDAPEFARVMLNRFSSWPTTTGESSDYGPP